MFALCNLPGLSSLHVFKIRFKSGEDARVSKCCHEQEQHAEGWKENTARAMGRRKAWIEVIGVFGAGLMQSRCDV